MHTIKYKKMAHVANMVQVARGERKREGFWEKKNNIEQSSIEM